MRLPRVAKTRPRPLLAGVRRQIKFIIMTYRKSLIIKIGFSLVFVFILIIHLLNIWKIRLDAIALILIILTLIPWFLNYVESLEIPGLGKLNISKMDHASTHIEVKKISSGENEIKIQGTFSPKIEYDPSMKYLSFKARINYIHEAGSQYLLQIIVNDTMLNPSQIVNRESSRKTADGRIRPSFNISNQSWSLVYSPDFVSNYSHAKYKVLNFDPYLFVFNVADIIENSKKIKVQINHIGDLTNEAQKNSIIVRDLILF